MSHAPPAYLTDFNEDTQKIWSQWMDMVFDLEIFPEVYKTKQKNGEWTDPDCKRLDPQNQLCMGDEDWDARVTLNRFYDYLQPTNRPPNPQEATGFPEWFAFPLTLQWGVFNATEKATGKAVSVLKPVDATPWQSPASGDGNNIFWQADQFRIYQDEYLEWAVIRDPATKKITKIIFTCEGPEYWQILAQYQPETVLDLYQSFNPGEEITKADLFPPGPDGQPVYNPYNKWNSPHPESGSIAHLIQPNSTLGAEVDIVAQATVGRPEAKNKTQLVKCGGWGEPNRASDPIIGWIANQAAYVNGQSISIHEPIGLYMRSFNKTGGLVPPADHEDFDVSTCFHIIRGKPGAAVRVEFYVPEGNDFVVGDLIDTTPTPPCPINYGSQVAQYITIGVKVDAGGLTDAPPPVKKDICEPRDAGLKDKDLNLYDVDNSKFLHFMQYKALLRAQQKLDPWQQWIEEYPILSLWEKESGGNVPDNLENQPEIKPSACLLSSGKGPRR